jgi:hypothetical protein
MSMTQRKFAIIFSITRMQKHSRLYFKAVSFSKNPSYQSGQTSLMASLVNANINGIHLLSYRISTAFFNAQYTSLKVWLSAEAKRFVKNTLECRQIGRLWQKAASRIPLTNCFLIEKEGCLCVN